MPSFTLDNANMTIDNATYGVSQSGMKDYIEALNTSLISGTKNILEDVRDIQAAIDAGWNGPAKASFLKALAASIQKVEEALDAEEKDLRKKLDILQSSYLSAEEMLSRQIDEQR